MSNITYRPMEKDEFEKCLDIVCEAFEDYSMYHVFIPNAETNLANFNRAIMSCQLADSMANGIIMVAERDGEILAVSQIHSPEYKEATVFQYLFLGAFSVFRYGGIRNALGFLDMVEKCNANNIEFKNKTPNCWNLECIAVGKKYHGQGIGSHFIQDCIIPYVKKEGAKYITLITNEEKNTHFYKKNGFELTNDEQKFTFNNKPISNWSFKRDL